MDVRIYHYPACSTCRKALAFLRREGLDYDAVNIVETPPSLQELRAMLAAVGGDVKKLFNTSGELYRELKLKDRIGSMAEESLLELLAANGKLIKRPFLIAGEVKLVGFREDEWSQALSTP